MGLDMINILKKEKGLTNEELAELSGVPKGTLDKITSGATRDPKLQTLKSLSRVLGCSLDAFDDEPAPKEPEEAVQNRVRVLSDFFVAQGMMAPGGDISDQDLEFCMALLSLMDAYFQKRG